MIRGFEKYTKDLTVVDKRVAEALAKMLSAREGSDLAMTNERISYWLKTKYWNQEFSDSKIRKLISYIRLSHLCRRLVATSQGYYVEPDDDKVREYILSLRERAGAIDAIAEAIEKDITPVPQSGDLFGSISHTSPREPED